MYQLSKSVIKNPVKNRLTYRHYTSVCVKHHQPYGGKKECLRTTPHYLKCRQSEGSRAVLHNDEADMHLMLSKVYHDRSLRPYIFHSVKAKKKHEQSKILVSQKELKTSLPVLCEEQKDHIVSVEQFLWQYCQELFISKCATERVIPVSDTSNFCQPVNEETKQIEARESVAGYTKGIFTGKQLDSLFGLEEKDAKKCSDSFYSMTETLQDYFNTASRNLSELVSGATLSKCDNSETNQPVSAVNCDNNGDCVVGTDAGLSLYDTDVFKEDTNMFTREYKEPCSVQNSMGKSVMYCVSSDSTPRPAAGKRETETNRPNQDQLLQVQDNLATELPKVLFKTVSYAMYSKDIILENNMANRPYVTKPGIGSYALQILKLKWYIGWKYVNCGLTILKSTTHPEDGTVRIRWQFHGLPQMKILKFWTFFPGNYKHSKQKESEYIDGFSTFSVNKDGLIYRHRIDKVIPDDHKVIHAKPSFVEKLRKLVTSVGAPAPT